MYSSGWLDNVKLFWPRMLICGEAPVKPPVENTCTPGARAEMTSVRLVIGPVATIESAAIVSMRFPTSRLRWLPVAVTTMRSSSVGAGSSAISTVSSCPVTVTDWLCFAYPMRLTVSV